MSDQMFNRATQEPKLKEAKRVLYHLILTTLEPSDNEIELGYRLAKDEQSQEILRKGLDR